jgi:hypothetical protein
MGIFHSKCEKERALGKPGVTMPHSVVWVRALNAFVSLVVDAFGLTNRDTKEMLSPASYARLRPDLRAGAASRASLAAAAGFFLPSV